MASMTVRRGCSTALLALVAGWLSACTPVGVVVGAGATAGVASSQERGLGGALSDTRIQAAINEKWLQHSIDMLQRLQLEVHEGRVLLTGSVPTPEMRLDAVRLTWQVDGVREVINEIQVGQGESTLVAARDVWISTQLRTQITFDRNIQAVNYSIETVNGVVYLMGVGQNLAEIERVTNYARNLRYVQRVVSLVRIKDPVTSAPAPRPDTAVPAAPADATPAPTATPGGRAPVTVEPVGPGRGVPPT